ncbi:MAG: GatB/YqeY domain-containing protein [Bdellovibrionaceae bacterium]|nr:GatB/YqeY domain-containing protein [Pseudobdellovibrionaceae bacterium]MBX3034932.1 GatB/YqeY domain-containing protein [Pseudobdellovibrionaceae bacterium]
MELRDQLMTDVKNAMKEKDSLKLNTLRFLQAAIKNREIEMRPNPINSDEIMGVIKKLVKQRKESIEQYQNGGRQDLADQENAELKILEAYLPAQLGRDQVEKIVAEVIAALGAKTVKDMGPVMKEVQARTAGAADNKMVSEVVRGKLS